jgi:hypothetical protein
LREKDILVSLIFGGAVYAVWSMVVASTTGLFKDRFALNDVLAGLAFLPNGEQIHVLDAVQYSTVLTFEPNRPWHDSWLRGGREALDSRFLNVSK